jgi:CheY-like chemotaxis protein
VLVYGGAENAEELAEALAKSGHSVHLVNNEQELTSELETGGYDVVIAPYSEHSTVEASTESGLVQNTTFLPVALNDDEEKIAQQNYSSVMVADKAEIKNYLKAIHKSLKRKT